MISDLAEQQQLAPWMSSHLMHLCSKYLLIKSQDALEMEVFCCLKRVNASVCVSDLFLSGYTCMFSKWDRAVCMCKEVDDDTSMNIHPSIICNAYPAGLELIPGDTGRDRSLVHHRANV